MLTYEKDESGRHHTAKHGHDEGTRGDVLVGEVPEDRHAEPGENVIRVEQTGQHLNKVADHVVPPDTWCPEK